MESPQFPALPLRLRIKHVAPMKFTFSLRPDSVIDFLGKSCHPHFSAEKMETEKRLRVLPSSQRQAVAEPGSEARLPDSHPSISSPALRPPRMWPRLTHREHGPGPAPSCV